MDAETIGIGRLRACRVAEVDPERHSTWTRRGLWAGEPTPRPYTISEVFSLAVARLVADFGLPAAQAIAIANSRDPWHLLGSGELVMRISRDSDGKPYVGPVLDDTIFLTVNLTAVLDAVWLRFSAEALDLARSREEIAATSTTLQTFHEKLLKRLGRANGGR